MTTSKRPIALRLSALVIGEALVLAVIGFGTKHETKAVNQAVAEISDLRDPSPFRAALMGHLGKLHLALQGYLRTPDPSLEKQVRDSRSDFEALLPDFMKQNPKLFPQAAAEEIRRTFALLKDAIDRTLEDNAHQITSRTLLEQNFSTILYLIDHNLRPLIRRDQADGDERRDAVLNIENQARAWHENLTKAWTQQTEPAKAMTFENDNRGQTFLELYGRLELLSRERKAFNELKSIWIDSSDIARESFVKMNLVNQTQKVTDGEHETVVGTLNKYLPAMPPAELEAKKQAMMHGVQLKMGIICGLGIVGLASFIFAVILAYRWIRRPPPPADGIYRAEAQTEQKPPEPLGDPTLQMNLKGLIITWSRAAQSLYGYSAEEMQQESIGCLFESESEIARLGKELQAAKHTTFETIHKTKAGTPFPVRIEFRPVVDGKDRTTAISLICTKQ